jgi:anti-sigma factor RsiW
LNTRQSQCDADHAVNEKKLLGEYRFLGQVVSSSNKPKAVTGTRYAEVAIQPATGESPRQDQRVLGDIVSAHVRSLQGDHLTDVQTSDQHTVKPWFNGKLDLSPPVVDLTAQGFTLIGGRLDYVDGKDVASVVYRRRKHVINLFVTQASGSEQHGTKLDTMQGFNIRRWTAQGLELFAVSDINPEELQEFVDKFEAASHPVNRS